MPYGAKMCPQDQNGQNVKQPIFVKHGKEVEMKMRVYKLSMWRDMKIMSARSSHIKSALRSVIDSVD